MPVEMSKYRDPRDGSVCVMPHTRETVETKHGVFKKIKDITADNASPRAVIVQAAKLQPVPERAAAAGIVQMKDGTQEGKLILPPSAQPPNPAAEIVSPTPTSTVKLG